MLIKKIKNIQKIKYQKITFKINDIIKIINKKKKILTLYKDFKSRKISKDLIKKDKTFKTLLKIYKNYNEKLALKFYRKFSIHLKLKSSYDNSLKKTTNKETVLESYLILGQLILKIKYLNNLQKLNTMLKINDLILINYKKINSEFNFLITKNILNEFNLIKKVIK